MKKQLFYLFIFILFAIEIIQCLFIMKFIKWYEQYDVNFIYLILFSMSIVSFGIMTFFLVKGIYTLIKYKRK